MPIPLFVPKIDQYTLNNIEYYQIVCTNRTGTIILKDLNKDINKAYKGEMQLIAREMKIKGYSSMTKQQLIDQITPLLFFEN